MGKELCTEMHRIIMKPLTNKMLHFPTRGIAKLTINSSYNLIH